MKKTVKVKFVGFCDTFDVNKNTIYRLLQKHYDVQFCENGEEDYSICSLYGSDYVNAKGVRIFYNGEAVAPDFTLFDYYIGFDELHFSDRYVRCPNYLMNLKYADDVKLMLSRHTDAHEKREKFCSWVCSNGHADKIRDTIFDSLSEYKPVDSGGRYRNNMGIAEGVPDKRKFQQEYKFSLAIENTSYKGYTTEKLIESFAAGGLPIYWGDPDVSKYFNPRAFVNLMDYPTIEDGIEAVKALDNNDNLYQEMLSQKDLLNVSHVTDCMANLESFLTNIFEQPIEKSYRRPHGQAAGNFEGIVRNGLYPQETLFSRLKGIACRFGK